MSNLPLQSRPPKYPLGPKGLFGGMLPPTLGNPLSGNTPLTAPFKAVPTNKLQPPAPLTGAPIHNPAVRSTLLGVPNPQPTGPTHSTLFNTHIGLPHGVDPYENVSSHPADNVPVHQLPNGATSSVPVQRQVPAHAPPSVGVDYTTIPGSAARHPATGPSQLTDFSTLPGMKSPTQWHNHFPSQGSAYPSDARYPGVTGLPRTHASEGSYVPPQNGTLPPSPSPMHPNLNGLPPAAPDTSMRVLEHDPNPIQYKGKFAPHAQTPVSQWTPEMHKEFNASLSPDTQLSMLNNQVRMENMNRDMRDKVGMRGFGGIGGNSPAVTDSQKAMIDPLLAQNRQQEIDRWVSPSDAKQLKLGGAKPVDQVTPSLDESSPFWAGAGNSKVMPGTGTTAVSRNSEIGGKPSRGAELIGKSAMDKLNAQGITADMLASRKPGDATDLAFKQLQRESSTAQAKRLSEEGGGVSKARQYVQEQNDKKMIAHASKHGNLGLPNVKEALMRQNRRNELRAEQEDITDMSKVGKSANEKAAARQAYASTPVGRSFDAELKKLGGLTGGNVETGTMEAINRVLSEEGTSEGRKAFLNYIQQHPMINYKSYPGLKKKIDALSVANNVSAPNPSSKSALPKSSPEASGKAEDPLGVVARRGAKLVDDLVSGRELFPMSPQQEEELNRVPRVPYNRMPGKPWGY